MAATPTSGERARRPSREVPRPRAGDDRPRRRHRRAARVALFGCRSRGADWVTTFTSVAIYSVVALGLGILYGRVGMISLGQVALLAIGVLGRRAPRLATSLPFPLLLLAGRGDHRAWSATLDRPAGAPALGALPGADHADVRRRDRPSCSSATNFPNGGGGFTGRTATGALSGLRRCADRRIAEGDTAYYRYMVVVAALMFLLALAPRRAASRAAPGPRSARASPRRSPPASTSRSTSCGRSRSRRS